MIREEKSEESLYDFIARTVDETFVDNIPVESVKELPRFYMYMFGALAEIVFLGIFVYFVISVYDTGTNSRFISLDPTSGVCSEISKAVTGDYVGDTNGIWVGQDGFDYSAAIYAIGL